MWRSRFERWSDGVKMIISDSFVNSLLFWWQLGMVWFLQRNFRNRYSVYSLKFLKNIVYSLSVSLTFYSCSFICCKHNITGLIPKSVNGLMSFSYSQDILLSTSFTMELGAWQTVTYLCHMDSTAFCEACPKFKESISSNLIIYTFVRRNKCPSPEVSNISSTFAVRHNAAA